MPVTKITKKYKPFVGRGILFGEQVINTQDEYGNQIWMKVTSESKKMYLDFNNKKYTPLTEEEIIKLDNEQTLNNE